VGRKYRSEVTDGILYCLVSHDRGVFESDLEEDVRNLGKKVGFHVDHSTFHDHLNSLERLGFLSVHPSIEAGKKAPRTVIKPKFLTYLYALYSFKHATDKTYWALLNMHLEKLLELLRGSLADHFENYMESIAKLYEEDPDLAVLARALGHILTHGEKRSIILNDDFLAELAKEVFSGGAFMLAGETMNLDDLEKNYPKTLLNLYSRISKVLIQFLSAKKDLKPLVDVWLSTLKDVFPSLPLESRAALAASIKSELYPYYAKMMRGLPPGVASEYRRKIKSVSSEEEMALIFQCSKCSRLNVIVKNIFEFIKEGTFECGACGYKTPSKLTVDKYFLKWAEEKYIPKHLMPTLSRLLTEISVVTCRTLAHRNIAILGAPCTIEGEVEPPHPECTVTLTATDPEGAAHTFSTLTDADGKYRFTYTFNKLGVWNLRASWSGDEDHLGAYSENVELLVYKFD